jgi:hypothetical protein
MAKERQEPCLPNFTRPTKSQKRSAKRDKSHKSKYTKNVTQNDRLKAVCCLRRGLTVFLWGVHLLLLFGNENK